MFDIQIPTVSAEQTFSDIQMQPMMSKLMLPAGLPPYESKTEDFLLSGPVTKRKCHFLKNISYAS